MIELVFATILLLMLGSIRGKHLFLDVVTTHIHDKGLELRVCCGSQRWVSSSSVSSWSMYCDVLRSQATVRGGPVLLIRWVMAEHLQLPIEMRVPLSIPVHLTD